MKQFIVLYFNNYLEFYEKPLVFICEAEDYDQAYDNCDKSYPKGNILWIHECIELDDNEYNINAAMYEYFKNRV